MFHARSSSPISLLAHANESGSQPHHQLSPRGMSLLLRLLKSSLTSLHALPTSKPIGEYWRRLYRHTMILPANQTLPLLRHRQIALASLAPRSITRTTSSMAPLNLACLLLVPLLESLDLFPRSLLLLCELLLLELAARLLDGLAAAAGVDFAARADSEALVHAGADGGRGGHGGRVGGGRQIVCVEACVRGCESKARGRGLLGLDAQQWLLDHGAGGGCR